MERASTPPLPEAARYAARRDLANGLLDALFDLSHGSRRIFFLHRRKVLLDSRGNKLAMLAINAQQNVSLEALTGVHRRLYSFPRKGWEQLSDCLDALNSHKARNIYPIRIPEGNHAEAQALAKVALSWPALIMWQGDDTRSIHEQQKAGNDTVVPREHLIHLLQSEHHLFPRAICLPRLPAISSPR